MHVWISCASVGAGDTYLMTSVLAGAALQYADVLYTIGGAANYRAAHSYYAAAIDLSEGENVRALYGLCATAAQLNALRDSGKVRPCAVHCLGSHASEKLLQAQKVKIVACRLAVHCRSGQPESC